ncbi:MAG: maltose/maltodextrin ABC transporter substrate-binding protein MalE [Kangiellaceae bacterium]|nr:maltose/maltodextrin ABC transporter substrate-binding protein MalE [Kangiellaceae bacterium]|tara:strand:- start:1285 stop:2481 length:1197 start_codon:yes stop_codon:yes gene_type:complete
MKTTFVKTLVAGATAAVLGFSSLVANAALKEGELTIWINGDKGYNGLQKVGDKFTKELGIPVKVEHPDDAPAKFQKAAAANDGPDIFIWAHDRFGEWAKSGLIVPVKPSKKTKDANVDFAWDAMMYNSEYYGYPISIEAVGLVYNKDLVSEPPKTWQDVRDLDAKLAKDGKKAILWDYNNTYFTWPVIASAGGYAFKKTSAGYDGSTTGVNNAGSLKAVSLIKSLIDDGIMPAGADYSVMDAAMNKGEIAMMINGPWSWSNLRKSNINFGVAPIPAIDGNQGKPFVGVQGATLNAASPNKDLAIEFIENYLLAVDGLKTVNDDVPLGAVANKAFMKELASDPLIAATFENAQLGEPMPNIPEMGAFWDAMGKALGNVTNGRQKVEEALNDAAKRIQGK